MPFKRHRPETKEQIRRMGRLRWAERKKQITMTPSDLRRLKAGDVAPHHAHLLQEARQEAAAIYGALGGQETVTPQQVVLIEDLVRVGVVMRAELLRYLRHGDPDSGARVGTLAGQRRSTIALLGLERAAKDVDLRSYLATRANAETASQAAQDRAGNAINAKTTNGIDQPSDRAQRVEEPAS